MVDMRLGATETLFALLHQRDDTPMPDKSPKSKDKDKKQASAGKDQKKASAAAKAPAAPAAKKK
jgi:hypothetical protein